MRRLAITILTAPLLGLLAMMAGPAHADDSSTSVEVLQVSGLIDPIVARSINRAVDAAEANGAQVLILQMNTKGSVLNDADMTALLERVATAKVPVAVWVGPSRGSRAYGAGAQLMAVADVTSMVVGSRMGKIGAPLTVNGQPISFGDATTELRNGTMSFNEARLAGALKLDAANDEGMPTIRNMIGAMDGVEVDGRVLHTATATPTFRSLGVIEKFMHTVASPPIAFLLFVIGLGLLVFEFFTAGVGIAGFVGAMCAILGCYGFAVLPTRPAAVIVLVLAMLAFAIDVQVGIPRLWTGVGIVLFIVGAWVLYRDLPSTSLRPGWFTMIVAVGGVMLAFIVGMPSMVRTRFATPTIGREWMIGHEGAAVGAIDPDGVALVAGARWRARTNRATPLDAGAALRVVAIDGVTLEVEPLEGAARDYRERRSRTS